MISTHKPTAGRNRESLVGNFLEKHLPDYFGVDTGLILSRSGEFSKEADLCIVAQPWNAPLYLTSPSRILLVEAVYALIEVKTRLTPSALADAVTKCRRFKTLPRQFDDAPAPPRIADSLFILWAFEGPTPRTLKRNILKAISEVPTHEQPDFIIIPNSIVATSGTYRVLTKLGQFGSPFWLQTYQESGGDVNLALGDPTEVHDLGTHALLPFFIWLTSWLKRAGPRSAPLLEYLPNDYVYGHVV